MIKDYILEKINEIEDEAQINEIVEEVREKFNTQCDYYYAGEFDSPGYSIEFYVIVFIDENGKNQGQSVQIERY